jgi:hypothetical protein
VERLFYEIPILKFQIPILGVYNELLMALGWKWEVGSGKFFRSILRTTIINN